MRSMSAWLGSFLYPRGSRRKTFAVLRAYFDESGAHGQADDVFTVGGFVAREARWEKIERAWDAALRRRVWHSTDFENRRRDFEHWPGTNKARIHLVAGLANTIQTNEVFGSAHSVEVAAFRRHIWPGKPPHEVKRIAYALMLMSCLKDILVYFKAPRAEPIAFVCEELEGVEGYATDCFNHFKRKYRVTQFGPITFLPKSAFRGLQAADMMAYEGFKHITNQVIKEESRPVRKLLTALDRTKRLAVAYAAEKEISENADRWKSLLPAWPPRF